jgi:hypothetical protein
VSVTGSINSQGLWQVAFGGTALGQPIAPMTRSVSAQLAPAASLTVQTTGLSTAAGHYTTAAIDFAQFNDSSAQGAQALRQALLDARTADGRSFADSGVSVSTSYDAAARQWRVSLGAAAVGQNFAPFQGQVTPQAAAEARLQQTATGQTSSEWQRLQINQAGAFQLGFNGRYTSVLQSQGLSAGALQAALQALPGVGTGGVSVSAASGGGWDIRFGGSLAGRNLSALQVQAVRTLDLRLDSGTWADAVRLRLAGQADWARTIERVSGSTDAAWQATLAGELSADDVRRRYGAVHAEHLGGYAKLNRIQRLYRYLPEPVLRRLVTRGVGRPTLGDAEVAFRSLRYLDVLRPELLPALP